MLVLKDLQNILSSDFTLVGDVDNEEHRLEKVYIADEEVASYLEYEVIDIYYHWWQPGWDMFETELIIDIQKI